MTPGQALGEVWAAAVTQYRLATPRISGDGDPVRGRDVPPCGSGVFAQMSPDPSPDDPRLEKWDHIPLVPLLSVAPLSRSPILQRTEPPSLGTPASRQPEQESEPDPALEVTPPRCARDPVHPSTVPPRPRKRRRRGPPSSPPAIPAASSSAAGRGEQRRASPLLGFEYHFQLFCRLNACLELPIEGRAGVRHCSAARPLCLAALRAALNGKRPPQPSSRQKGSWGRAASSLPPSPMTFRPPSVQLPLSFCCSLTRAQRPGSILLISA